MSGNCTNATSAQNNAAGSVLDMWPLGVMVCGAGGMTSVIGLIYLLYDWDFTCKACRVICCNREDWCGCCYDCYECSNCCRRNYYSRRRTSHWHRRQEEEANQKVEWEVVNTWDPTSETKEGESDESLLQPVAPRSTVLCTPICATTETLFVETVVGGEEYRPQAHRGHAVLVSEL
ncbi:protein O19 [Cercopithecine betaherpesvirus 5]|uniref:Protein O19 n=1 Tax=Simian cytomegalovirus (strain Colburn) TaxID=50292 RepID=G8XU37_SCMVC|nr:protein O19 [Cercopithecine betaherpesvirus 5]